MLMALENMYSFKSGFFQATFLRFTDSVVCCKSSVHIVEFHCMNSSSANDCH